MIKVNAFFLPAQLLCPKCSARLGSFNWAGEQCSCGQWVTPSFQVHKGRVDETRTLSRRKNATKAWLVWIVQQKTPDNMHLIQCSLCVYVEWYEHSWCWMPECYRMWSGITLWSGATC